MPLVPGQRRRPQRVADPLEDVLGGAGDDRAHPSGQQHAGRPAAGRRRPGGRGIGQHAARTGQDGVHGTEVHGRDLVGLLGAQRVPHASGPGRPRRRTSRRPRRCRPRRSRDGAGTSRPVRPEWPGSRSARSGRTARRPARGPPTRRRSRARPRPRRSMANSRRAAAAGVGGDQGVAQPVGQRAPGLGPVQQPLSPTWVGVHPDARALCGEDAPGAELGRPDVGRSAPRPPPDRRRPRPGWPAHRCAPR